MQTYQQNQFRIREVGGRFWLYEYCEKNSQCVSTRFSSPDGGGQWFAYGHSDSAVTYVGAAYASMSSAKRALRKLLAEDREFYGADQP